MLSDKRIIFTVSNVTGFAFQYILYRYLFTFDSGKCPNIIIIIIIIVNVVTLATRWQLFTALSDLTYNSFPKVSETLLVLFLIHPSLKVINVPNRGDAIGT